MVDELPSAADIERFGDDGDQTGWCPECGASVWDEAESCPSCGAWIGGRVLRRPPAATAFHRRMMVVITIAILIVFFVVFVL